MPEFVLWGGARNGWAFMLFSFVCVPGMPLWQHHINHPSASMVAPPTLHNCYAVQVSFVNSICTTKGGTHVTHVVDQVTKWVS